MIETRDEAIYNCSGGDGREQEPVQADRSKNALSKTEFSSTRRACELLIDNIFGFVAYSMH